MWTRKYHDWLQHLGVHSVCRSCPDSEGTAGFWMIAAKQENIAEVLVGLKQVSVDPRHWMFQLLHYFMNSLTEHKRRGCSQGYGIGEIIDFIIIFHLACSKIRQNSTNKQELTKLRPITVVADMLLYKPPSDKTVIHLYLPKRKTYHFHSICKAHLQCKMQQS